MARYCVVMTAFGPVVEVESDSLKEARIVASKKTGYPTDDYTVGFEVKDK